MAKLTTKERKAIPKSEFAIPGKAPGPGSFPIEDASHARNALARASGKPVAGKVRAAVKRKFPSIMSKSQASRVSAVMAPMKKAVKKTSTPMTPPGYSEGEDY